MRLFGLIGYPLSHSFSKTYFTDKFKATGYNDCSYQNFEVADIKTLHDVMLSNSNLLGLNITIPYKTAILPLLDELDEEAAIIGAVNTIHRQSGLWKGYNTDAFGFQESLLPLLKSHHRRALIIGTGGASRAVAFVLSKLNISYIFISRTPDQTNAQVVGFNDVDHNMMTDHLLIINTTPLGMMPLTNNFPPIPYEYINKNHLVYDLIYNPQITIFLKHALKHGASIKNGLQMLQLQADKAWNIWNPPIT